MSPVKYVVCVPDGCADEPHPDLGGRTPLEAAHTPVLRALAERSIVGRAAVIPDGMAPGSDIGNLAILGYDPVRYHTGRAPIEAAAIGLRLPPDRIAFRCNLVVVDDAGVMVDFAGGHPDADAAVEVLAELQRELGSGGEWGGDGTVEFHAGLQYRHTMVAPISWQPTECVPPHDHTGRVAPLPVGGAAAQLTRLQEASRDVLAGYPALEANQIWLWGQGPQPVLPDFTDRFGVTAGLVTAVDLIRGLAVLTGMSVATVEGATGWYDTNYEGKRDAALAGLADGLDLFMIHVEATDEAGHAGDVAAKVKALEDWDARILAGLITGLESMGDWRLLLLPDHATPLALRTHTSADVPYLLCDSSVDGPGGIYSERGVAEAERVDGHRLMGRLVELGRPATRPDSHNR